MTTTMARVIMGLFTTGHKAAVAGYARMLRMRPEKMIVQAHVKMGKKKPITVYKTNSGKTIPIGVKEPKKPKSGIDIAGNKTNDPQSGYLDDYYWKMQDIDFQLSKIKDKVYK